VVMIGIVLFYFDLIFSKFFNAIGVLKTDPIEFGSSIYGQVMRYVIWLPVLATAVFLVWQHYRKERDAWRR